MRVVEQEVDWSVLKDVRLYAIIGFGLALYSSPQVVKIVLAAKDGVVAVGVREAHPMVIVTAFVGGCAAMYVMRGLRALILGSYVVLIGSYSLLGAQYDIADERGVTTRSFWLMQETVAWSEVTQLYYEEKNGSHVSRYRGVEHVVYGELCVYVAETLYTYSSFTVEEMAAIERTWVMAGV